MGVTRRVHEGLWRYWRAGCGRCTSGRPGPRAHPQPDECVDAQLGQVLFWGSLHLACTESEHRQREVHVHEPVLAVAHHVHPPLHTRSSFRFCGARASRSGSARLAVPLPPARELRHARPAAPLAEAVPEPLRVALIDAAGVLVEERVPLYNLLGRHDAPLLAARWRRSPTPALSGSRSRQLPGCAQPVRSKAKASTSSPLKSWGAAGSSCL